MSDFQRFEIPLVANLNTDTVNQDIEAIGTAGDHIRNNGILNDGGLTNIKEITVDDSATADQVYWTKGGKKLYIDNDVNNYYVGLDSFHKILLGKGVYEYRGVLNGYLDAVISISTSTLLAIKRDPTNSTRMILDELNTDLAVINTKYLTGLTSVYQYDRIIKCRNITFASFTGVYYSSLEEIAIKPESGSERTITLVNGNNGVYAEVCTDVGGVDRYYISNVGGVPYWKRTTDGSPLVIAGVDAGYNNLYPTSTKVLLTGDYYAQVGKATGLTKKLYSLAGNSLTTDYTSPSATDSIISCGRGWQVIKSGLDGGTGAVLRSLEFGVLKTSFPATSPPSFRPNINEEDLITSGAVVAALTGFNPQTGRLPAISVLSPIGDINNLESIQSCNNGIGLSFPTNTFALYRAIDERIHIFNVSTITAIKRKLVFSEISDRYIRLNIARDESIIDTQSFEVELNSGIDTGTEIPAYSANTQSSKLFRSSVAESYNSPIFNNADITTIRSQLYKDFAYYKDGSFVGGNQNLAGTSYLAPVNLPPPITSVFKNGAIKMPGQTAIQTPNFCGYRIENVLHGEWDMFTLLGQMYAFDGTDIYSLLMDGEIFTDKNKIAVASGLKFLAVSTDTAYFYSTFDNSLWSFDGGRAVTKIIKLNKKGSIVEGAWNTSNNELVIRTTAELIHLRDGVLTESPLPFATFEMQESRDGIYYVDGAVSKRYDYFTGAVQPLDWQSAYFGLQKNQTMLVGQYDIALSSPTKETTTLKATISTITDSGIQTQEKTYTITPEMWGVNAYTRLRFQPAQQYVLASSIRLQTNQNIIILSVDLLYRAYGTAVVNAERSL